MGGQHSQVNRSCKLDTFHIDNYGGIWYSVSGNSMKICHHWDSKNKKIKIVFKGTTSEHSRAEIAAIDVNRVGNMILESGGNYTVHWTDYHHYSFITLNGKVYVLSRERYLRECDVELITLALQGCGLNEKLNYIIEDKKGSGANMKEKEDLFAKTDFWSEIGKNSDIKNTYDSKFSC